MVRTKIGKIFRIEWVISGQQSVRIATRGRSYRKGRESEVFLTYTERWWLERKSGGFEQDISWNINYRFVFSRRDNFDRHEPAYHLTRKISPWNLRESHLSEGTAGFRKSVKCLLTPINSTNSVLGRKSTVRSRDSESPLTKERKARTFGLTPIRLIW